MERLQTVKAGLQRATCPCVMVIADPACQKACARNGLSLAELLRPFGVIRQLNGSVGVPVRTPAEHPLRLHSWRLRFYAADTMFQPAPEVADAYLRDSVLAAAAADAATSDVPDVEELLSSAAGRNAGSATPWFWAYRREYLRLMQFGEHETLDHPVACILALPADAEGDLAAAFAGLWRHASLPPLMQAGVMEAAGVLRHYVLVHDASSMGPEVLARAQDKLRQVAATLGSSCQVLSINSGAGGGAPVGPRLWSDMLHGCLPDGGAGEPAAGSRPAVPAGGLGAWLSESDLGGLSAFVHELAARHVIPHLEGRLRALNVQVTANRRGLKNQLKSLLWRKGGSSSSGGGQDSPRSSAPGTPSSATAASAASAASGLAASYASGSVESHMRQLSDLALMLGDYETATSTLRLLASDTKADKAYKAFAGVQEALGAAAVLAGAPPAEATAAYKEALYRYSQLSQGNPRSREGVRYATRSVLLLAEYLRVQRQLSDANWCFMKAHFQEDSLRAGLLLEQAAHCLLALSPPHTRKFAFHLVLAGLRYDMAEQKGLAQRCYRQVMGVYSGRRWTLIEEHLHDALGRQARDAGDAPAAVQHYMSMLCCPQNNLYCQRLYLTQFMDVLRAAQAQLGFPPMLELPLPEVNCERVGVQHDGQTCYSGIEARQVAGEAWKALDDALQPQLDGHPSSNWLAGSSRSRLAEAEEAAAEAAQRVCCVGEPVGVDVELSNPLQLDLSVTHLRLACTWEPPPGASPPAVRGAAADGPAAAAGEAGGAQQAQQQQQAAGFQVHEESVTLHGGERVVVHLRVVPLRPGSLQVGGVAWLLNGTAHGQAAFRIPRPRPRKPGSSSKVLIDVERPTPGGVSFRVLPPMPRLEVSVAGLPPTLLAGEVVQCTMRLRNSGAMTLQHLTMAAAVGGDGVGVFLGGGGAAGADAAAPAGLPAAAAGAAEGAPGGGSPAAAAAVRSPRTSLDGSGLSVAHSFRQGAAVFSLPASVRLGVGQELTLPVWFRAPHAGTAHFAVVWRYEPLVKLDALAYRSVRCARSVDTLPALHFAARMAAGVAGCPPGGCLLQVQLHNAASEALQATGLACPSASWQLLQPSTGEGGTTALRIEADGSATLHRQLAPAAGAAGEGPGSPLAADAGAAGGPGAAGSRAGLAEAEAALLEVSRQVAAALPKHLQQQQAYAGQGQAQGQQQHVERQWRRQQRQQQQQREEGGTDVVVLWQAPGKEGAPARHGFCCLHNQRLHTAPPIDARLQGPATVPHYFGAGQAPAGGGLAPLCVVPLTLLLRNTLAAPAAVCIELGKGPDGQATPLGVPTWEPSPSAAAAAAGSSAGGADASLAARPPGSADGGLTSSGSAPVALMAPGALAPARQYAWCGRTRLTLPVVQPGQAVEVPLRVAVTRPGKLALSDCLVSWHYAGPPHIAGSRAVPPHHCLVVQTQPQLLL